MLDTVLNDIKEIGGYRAAAIMDATGDVLITDTSNIKGELGLVLGSFNDIFVNGHRASEKLSLGKTKSMQFMAEGGIVMMTCSGVDARIHIHILVILAPDGNQGLARLQMDKAIQKAVAELSA